MSNAILITGGSGLIGSRLVRLLRERDPDRQVLLLTRAPHKNGGADERGVTTIGGDISLPGLGLADPSLCLRVTGIYHAAADTRFPAPREDLDATNVRGTEHVLRFAMTCPNLRRLHHVSTAFVSGKRAGILLETELDEGQDFFNEYERSKLTAEVLVRQYMERLPVTVYRPSIVVGDSTTGLTPHFRGWYQFMKASYAGHLEFLPAEPCFTPDVVPVDFVAAAILRIGAAPESAGKTFHLTAGPNRMTLGEMVDQWMELVAVHRLSVHRPYFQHTEPAGGTPRRRWLRMIEHLSPYLGRPAEFDRTQAETLLGPLRCPSLRTYYSRLADFGIKCRFEPPGDGFARPVGDGAPIAA